MLRPNLTVGQMHLQHRSDDRPQETKGGRVSAFIHGQMRFSLVLGAEPVAENIVAFGTSTLMLPPPEQ